VRIKPPRRRHLSGELITGSYRSIQRFYSDDALWTTVDEWHTYTDQCIGSFLAELRARLSSVPTVVANIGSGGRTYDFFADRQVHVDLLKRGLDGTTAVVAHAEMLPFRNGVFDAALCVGSVINHGDAAAIIRELSHILRPNGLAVVEFESSDGLHRLGETNRDGHGLAEAFYNDRMLIISEYSRAYIENTMEDAGLRIEEWHAFHIASSLFIRLGVADRYAVKATRLDRLCRRVPGLRDRGHNLLLVAYRR
jgi:SAM-dependent methyltransferase